ncbi:MAG: PDZ domain-containing protein [Candidatus Sericytochromatia bacterium]|nr:PDZ domain-containing protein [Candidatus Tanganyikabacteria bacterium]
MIKERRSLGSRVGRGLLIFGLMAGSFGVGMGVTPLKVAAETRSVSTFLHVYDLVRNEFIDRSIKDSKLEYGAIRGMLDTLDDPYTRFMEPKVFRSMQEERHGSFSGIGIQIGIRDKKLTVIAPIEDTPAWKAGLKSGDHILEVDGKPTKDMAIEEAVSLIRGQRGTKVKLQIERPGNPKPFPLAITRDNIVTKAVKSRELDGGIAYIKLSSFMSETADQEMRDALEKFKDKKALVLDLRGNPGGLLPNAVTIGLMFIEKGPIAQIVDREGNKERLPADDQPSSNKPVWPKSKPVVVLVDNGSASASEILGGALQDSHSAVLIGTKTFGKGLVQTVHALEGGAGLAITTNKYLTAGGNDIHKRGIIPDIVQEPMKVAQLPKGEAEDIPLEERKGWKDLQLDKGVAYLKGKLGMGPVVPIPAKNPALAEAGAPAGNQQAALPEIPKVLELSANVAFKPKATSLGGARDEAALINVLTDISAKLHGLTADQLSAIAKHKEFRIEVVGEASAEEGDGVAGERAEHVAAFVRGFFLNLGIPVKAQDLKVQARRKAEAEGTVEVRINLPYGEVLTGH